MCNDPPDPHIAGIGAVHFSVLRPRQPNDGSLWLYDRICRQWRSKHLHRPVGNTQGWIGGKYTSTYSDGYGGSTGTIGNKRVNTYEDGYGRTTGTIGKAQVNIYTDPSGHTTGTIGRRRLNCYTAGRTTTCN